MRATLKKTVITVGCIACYAPHSFTDDNPEQPAHALTMSRTLTWDADGEPPRPVAEPAPSSVAKAADRSPPPPVVWLGLALAPVAAFWLGRARRPANPAHDSARYRALQNQLKEELDAHETTLTEAHTLRRQLVEAQSTSAGIFDELLAQRQRRDAELTAHETLQRDIAAHAARARKLTRALRSAGAALARREAEVQDRSEEATRLRELLEASEGCILDLRAEKMALEARERELAAEVRRAHARAADAAERAAGDADAEREAEMLKSESDNLRRELDDVRSDLISLSTERAGLVEEIAALRQELQDSVRADDDEPTTEDQPMSPVEFDETIEALQQEIAARDRVIAALHGPDDVIELEEGDPTDPESLRQNLRRARRQVKSLKSDLRVRADVIQALESDGVELQKIEADLTEREATNAFLQNELALALGEVARLKKQYAATASDENTVDTLRSELDTSLARIASQENVIGDLQHALAQEGPAPPVSLEDRELIQQLRSDLDASRSLIRVLEQELLDLKNRGSAQEAG